MLNSPEIQAELQAIVDGIKRRADGMLPDDAAPFDADVEAGQVRAHGMVKTSSADGVPGFRNRAAQSRHNILLRSVGGR